DEAHRALVSQTLRSRVVLQTDGQLRTPRDIAVATMLGAEEWGIATGALVSLGCIMMRKCHLNTCPVGIATQDPELREKFRGQPEHLVNYIFLLAEGLREIMAELGLRTVDEMVGRSDLLERKDSSSRVRMQKIDLSALLPENSAPWVRADQGFELQDHEIEERYDSRVLLPEISVAMQSRRKASINSVVSNSDRSVGTMLSSWAVKTWGAHGLDHDSIRLNLRGAAGQSFMAFAAQGISAILEGECNDYCGKGLSGGKITLIQDRDFRANSATNVICGNTALYGATSGEFYACGSAGERFAVRNSGAHAVIEGVGDHCCEYMTGGSVVVLGNTGRNFAAGMSGGVAFVFDPDSKLHTKLNSQMVRCVRLDSSLDTGFLWQQISNHHRATNSQVAAQILDDWNNEIRNFMMVTPIESTNESVLPPRPSPHAEPNEPEHLSSIQTLKISAAGEEIHG
ncbi:glutamate synthase subunit alpha, partial [bacterium]|nr:glutamate synthase subunit alpha [bacterium]